MISRTPTISRTEFEVQTGWQFEPEGACKGEVCIPLSSSPGETVDLRAIAAEMGLPVVESRSHGLIAVGPESIGSRALTSARAPDLRLPDLDGNEFPLSSLRGQKVVIYAWAPY